MSTIMLFNGSPRPKGITSQMFAEVKRGIIDAGGEVIEYDLNNEGIKMCCGCMRCNSHEGCSQQDYLTPMYKQLKYCDGIVVGAPIYWCEPDAQVKRWLDRLYPLSGDHGKGFGARYPGKQYLTIYPVGDIDYDWYEPYMNFFDEQMKFLGWSPVVPHIVCNGTYQIENYTIPQEKLDAAYEAGKKLAAYTAPIPQVDPNEIRGRIL